MHFFFTMMLRILVITFPMRFATDLIRFYNCTYMTNITFIFWRLGQCLSTELFPRFNETLGAGGLCGFPGFLGSAQQASAPLSSSSSFLLFSLLLKATLLPVCKNLRDLCRHTAMMAGGAFSVS